MMKCFIAFTEMDAAYVQSNFAISGKLFSPQRKFVPLMDTQEGAVHAAMKAPMVASMKAVTEETDWFILELIFSEDKAFELVQSNILHRQAWLPAAGWRWYGVMQLKDAASVQWIRITVAPTGIDAWAEQTLIKKDRRPCGPCSGCLSTEGLLWLADEKNDYKAFCSKCWRAFFMESLLERAILSLHDEAARQYVLGDETGPISKP